MRSSKYTKNVLAPIVDGSASLADVMRKLGLKPTGGNYRYISSRLRHMGLDAAMARKSSLAERCAAILHSELDEAVRSSVSMAQVLTKLGLPPAGRAHRELKARIANLALDTSHFRGAGWARGETRTTHPGLASASRRQRLADDEIFIANSRYTKGKQIVSRLVERGWTYRCALCGIDRWCDRPLVLHLDHINGIHNDNRVENLRLLCPNCHSQTETYCRRRT